MRFHSPRFVAALLCVSLTGACSSGDIEVIETGPPVTAEALCAELAATLCGAEETCCVREVDDDCEETQEARCTDSLGALLSDPRVGYVPERGGALLAKAQTRASGCWAEPFELADLDAVFEGTGAPGSDCSPRAVDAAVSAGELHRSAVACEDGTSCRLRLDWEGAPIGTCEARDEAGADRCSHPYDCARGEFCNVSGDWQVGDWASCAPLRGDGWACAQDFECESGYCDGTCGRRPELARCLVVDYPQVVLSSSPVAYYRLDERSGTSAADASENRNGASYAGMVVHAEEGALTDDGALTLDGMGGHLTSTMLEGLAEEEALTVELWVQLPVEGASGGPLLELNDADGSIQISLTSAGLVRARFVEPGEKAPVVVELATADGAVGAGFHHVALVYGEESTSLFVDGTSVATLAGARVLADEPLLFVGAHPAEEPEMPSYFAGSIDELAIYTSALTAETLASHVRLVREGPIENDFALFAWSR